MDIGRAFRFVFDDPKWFSKLLIGGLLALVPVVNFFGIFAVVGYGLRLTRRVAEGYDTPLPEWDDLGGLFVLGLKWTVAQLLWALPMAGAIAVISAGGTADDGGLLAIGILALLALIVGWALVMPAVSAHVAATESIAAAADWRTIVALVRADFGDYAVLLPLGIVLGLIGQAGWVLFGIGILVTVPWATLATAHLWGQAYYRGRTVLALMAAAPAAPAAPLPAPAAPTAGGTLPPLEP